MKGNIYCGESSSYYEIVTGDCRFSKYGLLKILFYDLFLKNSNNNLSSTENIYTYMIKFDLEISEYYECIFKYMKNQIINSNSILLNNYEDICNKTNKYMIKYIENFRYINMKDYPYKFWKYYDQYRRHLITIDEFAELSNISYLNLIEYLFCLRNE